MYSAFGSLDDAHQVFDEIPSKNVVCWTSLISAYVDNGKPSKALKLFRQMQIESVDPDQITITVALSACADLGALEMGGWIYAYARRKQGFEVDLCLNNALINMYAKCGDVRTARRIFDRVKVKDVTTWTSMIVGHAIHGQAEEALELFREMRTDDNSSTGSKLIHPNEITFIGVLIACSHGGLVEEGFHHLESMTKRYTLKPRISHYGCMVDLLCRAGLLKEAYDFIMEMPISPNAVIWRTLLGACSLQSNIELGENVRHQLLELEPAYVGDDVTMSNTYAAAGMWDEKVVVRNRVKQRRAPGCSSIEVESEVHEFVAADKKHPQCRVIYEVLGGMAMNMKTYGNGTMYAR
ncbi:Pentatricopeptide repeat [Macleaya cordata]|uniref:Pentatricopeptide repeat n=1 Tax=Macleaya cordata TaxID=56857 RepID=A0A200QP29_MACCD|nr:Pentatricopeptide repeat [Macleaya cordata]